jgi:hypothetical protein
VPSVPVSSVRKLLSARLWAASSAASRCASCASNAAKGRQQLGAAGARLGHRLRQLLVHRLAHRLQAVAGRLRETLQLVRHAVERAVVLGHFHAGRLRLLLQPLELREQLGRQLDARLAQQRDDLQRRDEDRSAKEDQEMGVRHGAWLKSRRDQSHRHECMILQYL